MEKISSNWNLIIKFLVQVRISIEFSFGTFMESTKGLWKCTKSQLKSSGRDYAAMRSYIVIVLQISNMTSRWPLHFKTLVTVLYTVQTHLVTLSFHCQNQCVFHSPLTHRRTHTLSLSLSFRQPFSRSLFHLHLVITQNLLVGFH